MDGWFPFFVFCSEEPRVFERARAERERAAGKQDQLFCSGLDWMGRHGAAGECFDSIKSNREWTFAVCSVVVVSVWLTVGETVKKRYAPYSTVGATLVVGGGVLRCS